MFREERAAGRLVRRLSLAALLLWAPAGLDAGGRQGRVLHAHEGTLTEHDGRAFWLAEYRLPDPGRPPSLFVYTADSGTRFFIDGREVRRAELPRPPFRAVAVWSEAPWGRLAELRVKTR